MNNLKKQFVTSDWHINHEKILEYSKRPFKNVDHMHESLITRYNATVPQDGVCFFLGDMGMGSGEHIEKVVRRLNGTKVLVLGNHDKNVHAMYHKGFDVVVYGLKTMIANEIVSMSHCPLMGVYRENTEGMKATHPSVFENWHGEARSQIHKYSFLNEDQFHLHGHIHSPNNGRSEKTLLKQYDVGVDANNYTPVSFSTIESWITKYKGKVSC